MEAILILLIISVQFAIVYFGVKYLSNLNNSIIAINEKILLIQPQIQPKFEQARKIFTTINNAIEKFVEKDNKLKLFRNILILKSLAVAIIIFKKRKSLFSFFSLYDIVSKFTKTILEL